MTNPDEVPESVFQFLAERIDAVPQLEALLLLWQDRERAWSTDELASRIYVCAEQAAGILQALERRQLVRVMGSSPSLYQYDGGWDPAGERMVQVAEAYRLHMIRLATFIHRGASSSVREFARAFDLKKDR